MPSSSLAKRNSSAPTIRKGPSPKVLKLEDRIAKLQKRVRETASSNEDVMIAGGATFGLALTEKKIAEKNAKNGKANEEPLPTVGGIDPFLLYGAVLHFGGPKILGGKNGKRLAAAGEGILTAGIGRATTRGSYLTDRALKEQKAKQQAPGVTRVRGVGHGGGGEDDLTE